MEVIFSNSVAEWIYNGSKIKYFNTGIEFAYGDSRYVRVDIFNDGHMEYHYVTFDGHEICNYDEMGNMSIFTKSGKQEIKIKDIDDVCIYNEKIYVMCEGTDILIYDEGVCKERIKHPYGFSYYRFFDSDNLEVVCEAEESFKDKYGRKDYIFEYDYVLNSWNKKGLAY